MLVTAIEELLQHRLRGAGGTGHPRVAPVQGDSRGQQMHGDMVAGVTDRVAGVVDIQTVRQSGDVAVAEFAQQRQQPLLAGRAGGWSGQSAPGQPRAAQVRPRAGGGITQGLIACQVVGARRERRGGHLSCLHSGQQRRRHDATDDAHPLPRGHAGPPSHSQRGTLVSCPDGAQCSQQPLLTERVQALVRVRMRWSERQVKSQSVIKRLHFCTRHRTHPDADVPDIDRADLLGLSFRINVQPGCLGRRQKNLKRQNSTNVACDRADRDDPPPESESGPVRRIVGHDYCGSDLAGFTPRSRRLEIDEVNGTTADHSIPSGLCESQARALLLSCHSLNASE